MTAYNFTPLAQLGYTGRGQTIAVLTSVETPFIRQDLHKFDLAWGLVDPIITSVQPFGTSGHTEKTDDSEMSWRAETTLDVEWVHAIAPGAGIVIVRASSSAYENLVDAAAYAIIHNVADILSLSYGYNERCISEALLARQHSAFEAAKSKGITVVAASGDLGAASSSCGGGPKYETAVDSPASDPLVLAVGGTSLAADPNGKYLGEHAMNESAEFSQASGGGFSGRFPRPEYQSALTRRDGRAIPDVSYSAGRVGGTPVFIEQDGGWNVQGGTSAAAPQWAGLVALANEMAHRRLGFINEKLYSASTGCREHILHDVQNGNNSFHYASSDGTAAVIDGFQAIPGWDAATGLGSPSASDLVRFLAADPSFTC